MWVLRRPMPLSSVCEIDGKLAGQLDGLRRVHAS